ncbi:hypothetical protein Leryth_027695 [Lithospermum erythrorhizon]|nr:hypothetical protein Leryth_027695 [Lithospermum erythrorhizon]
MGFPVGYSDLFLPKLLLQILCLLTYLKKFIYIFLNFVGFGDFLEPEISIQAEPSSDSCSIGAVLMREFLPVAKFSELIDPPESCAVCLYEFDLDDQVRRLTNCRHIFHKCCLDRWLDHYQKTCPLCRMPFVPKDMQQSFNERIWMTSGISDLYGDHSIITTDL